MSDVEYNLLLMFGSAYAAFLLYKMLENAR
jgi:hypothetical protein